MKLSTTFDDLLESAAHSPGERARRWDAVRRAVGGVSPHFVVGGLARLRPRDLRIAFVAIDLHFFHTAYRACFDNERDIRFAWRIDDTFFGSDTTLEHHATDDDDLFEFVLHRRRVTKIVEEELAIVATFDGMSTRDALDVVLICLAQSMLHMLAIVDAPRISAVAPIHAALLARFLPFVPAKAP